MNKIAEAKAALRAELAGLADKVPEFVNAGGVMTTRDWLPANEKARRVKAGGYKRMSRASLERLVAQMKTPPDVYVPVEGRMGKVSRGEP
jgi:hypothetical protein